MPRLSLTEADPTLSGMWRVYIRNHSRLGPWYTRIERQPGWVIRAALLATVLIVVVPIGLLMLAALVVGVVVFAVLGAAAWLLGAAGRMLGGRADGGRVNVRVVHRQEP